MSRQTLNCFVRYKIADADVTAVRNSLHPETSILHLLPVVSDEEREEVGAGVDDHPELLHEGLAVEEVVGGHQEIPGVENSLNKYLHLILCW